MRVETLLILSIIPLVILTEELFTLQLLPTERGARCLDGSPAGLYYMEGKGDNKNKFIIYMNSGGFCSGFTL